MVHFFDPPFGNAHSLRRALVLGWIYYLEQVRRMPLGGVFVLIAPSLISGVVAGLFSFRAHGQLDYCRFEYICFAMFSFLLLLDSVFTAFGLAWKQRRLILNSNFSLFQISLSSLLVPAFQTIFFSVLTALVFENSLEHLAYLFVLFVWVAGLQQLVRFIGSFARWLGRVGPLLGRAFFISSPIIWIPQNDFQVLLAQFNPLMELLRQYGISWNCSATFDMSNLLWLPIPFVLFCLLSRACLRSWFCEKLF